MKELPTSIVDAIQREIDRLKGTYEYLRGCANESHGKAREEYVALVQRNQVRVDEMETWLYENTKS